jgi:hypothetical protein
MDYILTAPFRYIVESVDASGYEKEPQTPREKMQFIYDTFVSEYGWHIEQVGLPKALASWLAGLPSSCNIEYRNHAILELGEKWGEIARNAGEARQDAYLNQWFANQAARIALLWAFFDIDTKAA